MSTISPTKSPLIIKHNYVYNPTNEWCQCSVKGGEQIHTIVVIPPRSSRTFPSTLVNPEIVNFRNLRPDQINSYEINQEPIVLEPIKAQFDAEWKGTLELNGIEKGITAYLLAQVTKIFGLVIYESTRFLLRGSINPKARSVNCSIFDIAQKEEIKLTGRIENNTEDTEYTLLLNGTDHHIILNADNTDKTTFAKDPTITGKYMAFYTKGQSQNEMSLQIESYSHGILGGNGNESENFEVLGLADNGKDFILLRFGGEVTYYTGTVSANNNEVFIEGTYQGRDSGQFTFIKEM
ncbi:hypothetical protein M9Y10_008987 [Tritrichomonas musculus]|uniref:Uncharacterized protein n=1 Tax=Tritrichomonas musculus TaxID=1915356 RepID=A0ABR2IZU7_9EUKA